MSRKVTLTEAYRDGMLDGLKFLGNNLLNATMTALAFAFVYKFVIAKDKATTGTEQGQ